VRCCTPAQERLAKLREGVRKEDEHDSTLGAVFRSDKTAEEQRVEQVLLIVVPVP
jgi:hypothetical protein